MALLTGDEFAAVGDRVIRLRAEGLTYKQLAGHFGWSSATEAQRRYRNARARQIPAQHKPRTHARPEEMLVAWAAGFFDGEGCIYGYEGESRGYRRMTFGIAVAQTTPEPLNLLAEAWGGTVRAKAAPTPRHRDQWIWECRGVDAGHFLSDIRPYMRVKARAADAALPCLLGTHSHGVKFTAPEVEQRRSAIAVLRETNHRGEV